MVTGPELRAVGWSDAAVRALIPDGIVFEDRAAERAKERWQVAYHREQIRAVLAHPRLSPYIRSGEPKFWHDPSVRSQMAGIQVRAYPGAEGRAKVTEQFISTQKAKAAPGVQNTQGSGRAAPLGSSTVGSAPAAAPAVNYAYPVPAADPVIRTKRPARPAPAAPTPPAQAPAPAPARGVGKYRRLVAAAERWQATPREARKPGSEQIVRNPHARAAVLARSGGRCENPGCTGQPQDVTTSGDPILEIDHVHEIARGGPDDPHHMVALCPNCHAVKTRGSTRDALRKVLLEVARRAHARAMTGDT
ncbi:HNH endonuclease signature motif containing protein [Streptomyces sp. 4.24]|uniref:HNH endonuclease signature motif containing protein n=1 Tax=Streptomyces tritrimontium TaxID=3406573 RepID=UPI003BB50186